MPLEGDGDVCHNNETGLCMARLLEEFRTELLGEVYELQKKKKEKKERTLRRPSKTLCEVAMVCVTQAQQFECCLAMNGPKMDKQ